MAYPQDKLLAERLIQQDPIAWEEFRKRFEARILHIAVRWCGLSCRPDCPGYGGQAHRSPSTSVVCPVAYDAYVFIVEKLIKTLFAYRGDCRLETWFHPLLTPSMRAQRDSKEAGRDTSDTWLAKPQYAANQDPGKRYNYQKLHADYVRHIRGRIRVPKCLQDRPKAYQKLFLMTAYGNTPEEIVAELHVPVSKVVPIQTEMIETLREQDYASYYRIFIAGKLIDDPVSIDQSQPENDGPNSTLEIADPEPTLDIVVSVQQIVALLYKAIRHMAVADTALLSLRYDQLKRSNARDSEAGSGEELQMEAIAIADLFRCLGYPDLGDPKRIYTRLRTLRGQLARQIDADLGGNTYVDEKRMDAVLNDWGTGSPEIKFKLVAAAERKSVAPQPSNTHASE